MKEPHNQRTAGYSMIVVAASLTIIGLMYIGFGSDVLFGDTIQRENTEAFEECKQNNFAGDDCAKYAKAVEMDPSTGGKKISLTLTEDVSGTGNP